MANSAWKNRIVGSGTEDPKKLVENPRNWRLHPKHQQDALEDVLKEVGWVQNILVNQRTGHVVDGHLRVSLAIHRSEESVPVVYVDLSEKEEALILAAIDPLAALAETSKEKLDKLLHEVETSGPALQQMMANLAVENGLLPAENSGVDAEPQIDKAAELLEKWKVERGQVWQLGVHRLMCGDSTSPEDVGILLDEAKPFIMVTDPPYGVEYEPSWRNEAAAKGQICFAASREGLVSNDNRLDWTEAYKLFPGKVSYVWHSDRFAADVVVNIRNSGFEVRAQIIWKKPTFAISRGHYHWQHESCWYSVRDGSSKWCGDRSQSTFWDISNRQTEHTDHGTQKPVECMARPIRNHGGKDDDVYDPFVGSGTTIIAAEQLNRRCFAMEIDPKYVAVCLQRFIDATEKQPTLVEQPMAVKA